MKQPCYGGDPLLTCRLNLIFLARHEDPQIRDEMVELLLNVAADALGGNSLGGAGIPARTQIKSDSWQKAKVGPSGKLVSVLSRKTETLKGGVLGGGR